MSAIARVGVEVCYDNTPLQTMVVDRVGRVLSRREVVGEERWKLRGGLRRLDVVSEDCRRLGELVLVLANSLEPQ